jgi:LynF/TruF/PatF family peptide O-prenyltransferase
MSSGRGQGKAVREFGESIFSPEKNLACMDFHRAAFGIGRSPLIEAFERLVTRQRGCTVESSCKVSDGSVHAARWNLFFHDKEKGQHLRAVLDFFRKVEAETGAKLNHGLFREFYGEDFDLSTVRKVVTGVDLRDDEPASRVKLWFMLRDYPERVERAIALHGDNAAVRPLILHAEFLVGFDFHLDGRAAIKLYPDIWEKELHEKGVQRRLREALSDPAVEAMEECRWTHICIARHNPERVLHYHPSRPREFIDRFLSCPMARAIHRVYEDTLLSDMVVSMREGELREGRVRNYTLYYMPARFPAGGKKDPRAPGRRNTSGSHGDAKLSG